MHGISTEALVGFALLGVVFVLVPLLTLAIGIYTRRAFRSGMLQEDEAYTVKDLFAAPTIAAGAAKSAS